MPRPALTPEKREATRRRIRQAAAELYASDGKTDVSARAIAEKAGVSTGTLYQYFDNLRELLQSLWKEPVSRFLEDFLAISQRTSDPRKRLRKLLGAYIAFATGEDQLYRGAFLFVRPDSHPKPTPVALKEDRLFSILRGAVADGQKAGVFRKGDPSKITQLLWAGVHGSIALPTNIDRLALDPPERSAKRAIAREILQDENSDWNSPLVTI